MNKKEIARTKRRYRMKHPAYRQPLFMYITQDLGSARIITPGSHHLTTLPAGQYEIRIIANPDPEKRGRGTEWIVTSYGNHLVGAAKNYIKNLQRAGVVEIYLGKRQVFPQT